MSKIVVKYTVNGISLEVLAKGGTIEKFRRGNIDIDHVLLADDIYKNAKRNSKATDNDLKTAFDSLDRMAAIKEVLMKGEFPLTTAEMRERVASRRQEILNHLHKYYHDPLRGHSHPISRFDSALRELKYVVDTKESLDNQIRFLVNKLPDLMPIKAVGAPLIEKENREIERRAATKKFKELKMKNSNGLGSGKDKRKQRGNAKKGIDY